MDFQFDGRSLRMQEVMRDFLVERVIPAEAEFEAYRREHGVHAHPPIVEELKERARELGLWNLFLPELGGLGNVDYAPIAELSGWSPVIAPEALNCQAPDTGNMELLHRFGTDAQRERWLRPLMDGEIRSAFAMTEPDVASSDARNIATRITYVPEDPRGPGYVINGRKWWITGVADERCRIFIVMGRTDEEGDPGRRQSMVLVERDNPGLQIIRHLPTFGYQDQHGHSELSFTDCYVPESAMLGARGDGFMLAQARLGPGRIHHAMRAVGMAERALALLIERAAQRRAFGDLLVDQGVVREHIARSRIAIDEVRLAVLHAAWRIDRDGAKAARDEIAAIKVSAPAMACQVIDRAIEVFGAAGVSDDTPLAYFYNWARVLRIVDGPDAVHLRSIARAEIRARAKEGHGPLLRS